MMNTIDRQDAYERFANDHVDRDDSAECADCGDWDERRYMLYWDGEWYHTGCLDDVTEVCDCGERMAPADMHSADGLRFCPPCLAQWRKDNPVPGEVAA